MQNKIQRDAYYSSCNVVQGLDSGNIKFVRVSAVVRKETSNDSGVARHAHVLRSHAEVYSLCA